MEDKKKGSSGTPELPAKRKLRLEHWHQVAAFLILYDLIAVTGAYFAALWLRFDCQFSEIPIRYLTPWLQFAPIYAVVCVITFWKLRLYQSVWRFVSFVELKKITVATVFLGIFHTVFITIFFKRMPITYYTIGAIVQFLLIFFARFAYRFFLLERNKDTKDATRSRVMLIGAGEAGQMLLRR